MNGSSNKVEEFLERLTEITKANLTNSQFGVSELARELGMSRSNLHLKIHAHLKISVSQFIRQKRLEKGLELLRQTSLTVSEVTWETGFGSVSYFTKCFREYYGFPPGEVGNHEIENDNFPARERKRKITILLIGLSGIVLSLILYLILFPLPGKEVEIEKTIAVLPFRNESHDSTNTYFINGLMESILNNLSNIPDLKVRSRTSVESYRNTTKLLSEIAKELGVNYIVEGSGQKYGDLVVLHIQLLEANTDRHLLSKQYRKELKEMKDFIGFQNEIALNLASEIIKTIKPEELLWHNEISTENYEALDYYFQGYELQKLSEGSKNRLKMKIQARAKFEKALELDSTFALPLIQLSWIYVTFFQEGKIDNLDSAFYFANKALHYDNESANVYGLFGSLYQSKGNLDEALKNYQKHIQYGGNHYRNLGVLYFQMGEYLKGIEYTFKQHQYLLEEYQNMDYWTLIVLQHQLRMLGFFEESKKYSDLIFKQYKDTSAYFERRMFLHFTFGNFDSVVYIGEQRIKIDSTNLSWTIPVAYLNLKNNKEAYRWIKFSDYDKKILEPDDQDEIEGLAFILLQNGQTEKADSVFSEAIKNLNHPNKINIYPELFAANIRLASVYSAMNEKEKAMDYLRANKSTHLLALTILKSSPLFDNIRNEPEFQKIVKDVEIKFQKHHKQVAEFLRKKGEFK